MYIPFTYAADCKRNPSNGLPFFVDNLIDDFAIILIAFATLSSDPVAMFAALMLLHFSLWAVYEVGYYENDLVAATLEPDGKIPPKFDRYRAKFSEPMSWGVAALLGAMGLAVAFQGGLMPAALAASGVMGWLAAAVIWALVLLALRRTYRVYNHADKMTRTFLYLPLQVFKYGFGAVFFALPAAGAALIFAQICRRWIPYVIYRHLGAKPDAVEPRVLRLFIFVTLWLLLLPAAWNMGHVLVGAAGFGLLALRAQARLRRLWRRATVASNDQWRAAS